MVPGLLYILNWNLKVVSVFAIDFEVALSGLPSGFH